jgi:hypothetical protein
MLERRGAIRRLPHFGDAAAARHQQEDILEQHPRRMLQPPPLAGDHHAVDRLRPEEAAQHVIQSHDDRRGNQDTPVAVEGQEGERSEHVEMRLDAPAGEMDQQRTHQHLGHGDHVTG